MLNFDAGAPAPPAADSTAAGPGVGPTAALQSGAYSLARTLTARIREEA
ncbi:hypothetical protein ACP3TD_03310 [Pseudarthrobacter sp. 1G09]